MSEFDVKALAEEIANQITNLAAQKTETTEKTKWINASEVSYADLQEYFRDFVEIDPGLIAVVKVNKTLQSRIYNDVKKHTEAVIEVKRTKGRETQEIRDIQSLIYCER